MLSSGGGLSINKATHLKTTMVSILVSVPKLKTEAIFSNFDRNALMILFQSIHGAGVLHYLPRHPNKTTFEQWLSTNRKKNNLIMNYLLYGEIMESCWRKHDCWSGNQWTELPQFLLLCRRHVNAVHSIGAEVSSTKTLMFYEIKSNPNVFTMLLQKPPLKHFRH